MEDKKMKEHKTTKFSREDLLKILNMKYNKEWTLEQLTMSSKGLVITELVEQ